MPSAQPPTYQQVVTQTMPSLPSAPTLTLPTVQVQSPPTVIIRSGACYKCGNGVPIDDYATCCGIFWCIVLFPIGILCLFLCKHKRCSNCGAQYS